MKAKSRGAVLGPSLVLVQKIQPAFLLAFASLPRLARPLSSCRLRLLSLLPASPRHKLARHGPLQPRRGDIAVLRETLCGSCQSQNVTLSPPHCRGGWSLARDPDPEPGQSTFTCCPAQEWTMPPSFRKPLAWTVRIQRTAVLAPVCLSHKLTALSLSLWSCCSHVCFVAQACQPFPGLFRNMVSPRPHTAAPSPLGSRANVTSSGRLTSAPRFSSRMCSSLPFSASTQVPGPPSCALRCPPQGRQPSRPTSQRLPQTRS